MRISSTFLRRVPAASVISSVKWMVVRAKSGWLRFASRWPFLCRLHYLLFSTAFNREIAAVVSGHVEYVQNREGFERTNYFLRRAVHRLEKGLLMRPRREVFALDYIEEAVQAYSRGLDADLDIEELAWADAVLEQYFETVSDHPIVDNAKESFQVARSNCQARIVGSGSNYIPYRRGVSEDSNVSIEAMEQLAVRRRSVRWYQEKLVPRSLIDKAVRIASLSPSACNRQPLEFRIFDDPAKVKRVAELPMGTGGFSNNIPAIAVLIGRLRAYPHSRDRHVIYVDGGLAAMSFMFALESLNLSSCPINWPDIKEREEKMQQELGLKRDERVIMLIAIGYADPSGLVAASRKVSLEQFRNYPDR